MIEVNKEAWATMVAHAEKTFPNECCGAMIGRIDGEHKVVTVATPIENTFQGAKEHRYEIRPEDLLAAEKAARAEGKDLIGIFHSHPDHDAYFSETDLNNSCPWYSFIVLSVKQGKFDHAASFLPNAEQTEAEKEELIWPKS